MQSEDRFLFGIIIRQETKTGFLNLSDLQEAYVHARIKYGWADKKVQELLSYEDNRERIFYLLNKQGYINTSLNEFIEEIKKQGIAHYLKKICAYKTTGARHTKTVWCNPYIWVLIAMELNPMLYAEVVTWLTDKLIINRIEAGNFYKGLSNSISKFKDVDYVRMAKALNYIIFNMHEPGIRNTGTIQQLKDLEDLEKKMAFAIDMGYINSFEDFLKQLRKIYTMKYGNNQIQNQ